MKKLICVAALAIAGFSYGAQCEWGFSGVATSADAATTYNYATYLVDSSVVARDAAIEAFAKGDFSALSEKGYIQLSAQTAQQGSNPKVRLGSTYSADVYSEGTKTAFYTLIFNNSDATKATEFIATAVVNAEAPGTGYLDYALGNLNLTQSDWQAVNVPEPTSGLLLLLGMAGLALRRRRA